MFSHCIVRWVKSTTADWIGLTTDQHIEEQ